MDDRLEPRTVLAADEVSPTRLLLFASTLPLVIGFVVTLSNGSTVPLYVGLGLTFAFLAMQRKTIRHQYQWRQPTLELRSRELQLGESVDWIYERASRNPIDVANARVTLTLNCKEEATYTRGTDRTTKKETVAEVLSHGPVEGTAEGLRATGTVVVPTNVGAPTMHLRNNIVWWWIEARLDGPDLPGGSEDFQVVVLPVLDVSLMHTPEIQDTVS